MNSRDVGDVGTRHVRRPLLLEAAIVLALWVVVLLGLSPVFEPGTWIAASVGVVTATTGVACAFRLRAETRLRRRRQVGSMATGVARPRGQLRPRYSASAWLAGTLAGILCTAGFVALSGRGTSWLQSPSDATAQAVAAALREIAPTLPREYFADVLLVAVLLIASLSALLLTGVWRWRGSGLVSAACVSLLLLICPGITGTPPPWWAILFSGLILAALVWLGAPRPRRRGLLSAVLAVALAAGVFAIAPPARDRTWNDQILQSPITSTVPDLTVSLAEDLRERSQTRAFRYRLGPPRAMRFTLVTLADFEGGVWQPQREQNSRGANVTTPRTIPGVQRTGDEATEFAAAQAALEDAFMGRLAQSGDVEITIEGLVSSWLPLPQAPGGVTSVDSNRFDPAQWVWSQEANTASSSHDLTRIGDKYVVSSEQLSPMGVTTLREMLSFDMSGFGADAFRTYPDVRSAPLETRQYLELPGELPQALKNAADQAAQNAAEVARRSSVVFEGVSEADMASAATDRIYIGMALESLFRGGEFAYDESAPYEPDADPNDPYAVMSALLTQKRGFCVHYASTFAILARHLGVPTRIALGYAVQSTRADGVVLGGDLHAWPEVLIDGVGWVPFEPTPGGAGVRADTFVDVPATPEAQPESESPSPSPSQQTPSARPDNEQAAKDPDAKSKANAPTGDWWQAVAGTALSLLAAAALIASPAILRRLRTRHRFASITRGEKPGEHAWCEFVDVAVDLGLLQRARGARGFSRLRAQTDLAIVEHLSSVGALSSPAFEAALLLAAVQSAERYDSPAAGDIRTASDSTELLEALQTALQGMRSSASRITRAQARIAPRSILSHAGRTHRDKDQTTPQVP